MSELTGPEGKPLKRKALPAAVATLLILPASLVGYGFRWIAIGLLLRFYGAGSSPASFFDIAALLVAPNVLFGVVTGTVAIGITLLVFREANLKAAAMTASVAWGILYVIGLGLGIYLRGWSYDVIQGLSIVCGIVIGTFSMAMDNSSGAVPPGRTWTV